MKALLTAALAMLLASAAQAQVIQRMTATYLGMDGVNLADTPETNAIPMDETRQMNQLTLQGVITWGTSTEVQVQCKGSDTESGTYTWVDRCTGTDPVQCKPLVWRWNSTDSADGLMTLEMPNNYRFLKCQFDDPGDGTGTIVVSGMRGRQ